ncbi:MAG: methyltransferase domain-containing protein, partial [Candidatus Bathyarchaeota archaeon]|nr:methyltransferase domain-containing protein [Candidatus Bathyarchaeota archaeon]
MNLKKQIRWAIWKLCKRNPVFLPALSYSMDEILTVAYPYRLETDTIIYRLCDNLLGKLDLLIQPWLPTNKCAPWQALKEARITSPCEIGVRLDTGEISINGVTSVHASPGLPSSLSSARKLISVLTLQTDDGRRCWRRTMHYKAQPGRAIDRQYYMGDDYRDYERSDGEAMRAAVEWVKKYSATGRILDVGCATGHFLEASLLQGFDSYGVDICEWAVAEAVKKVGANRAAVLNLEEKHQPAFEVPFDILFMSDVIEHFKAPWEVLSRLTAMTK